MNTSEASITELLNDWAAGNQAASDTAFALVYDQLHQTAAALLRHERPDPVLQTTGIVHEAFLRLSEQPGLTWRSREHFFAFASRVMRRVLVDHARQRRRTKRGGQAIHVALTEALESQRLQTTPLGPPRGTLQADVVAIHEALEALEAIDAPKARMVELRFFGGLSVLEVAAVLGVSESTVHRQWRLARAWLFDTLRVNSGDRS